MSEAPSPRDIETWSPAKWDHIAGNSELVQTLRNFAQNSPSNLLVTGPWRSGKTRTIKLGIKAMLCENRSQDLNPCGVCPSCRAVDTPLGEHTGLFKELAGSKYSFVQIDCENVSPETLKTLPDHIQWDDERLIVYLDEVSALGRRNLDRLMLKPIDEWSCVWIASAKSVVERGLLGKRTKVAGLSEDVRGRFSKKSGTAVPSNDELAPWIKKRCQEWVISIENEAETIPLLMKRAHNLIGYVKQPIVIAASRGSTLVTRVLRLSDVRSFNFEALD